jgi:hypothetical protein
MTMQNDDHDLALARRWATRRSLLAGAGLPLGAAALSTLLPRGATAGAAPAASSPSSHPGVPGLPHLPARAKRVIYLFLAGAPSQIDTFDYKPRMVDLYDKDLPESVRGNQRLTTMTSGQTRFPVVPSMFKFKQAGQSGAWVSELLPHTAGIVDKVSFVKTVHTEAINHDPGITYIQTGNQVPGKPSCGAWVSYGLGSENRDLPSYVVLMPRFSSKSGAQALFSRLWGPGFLPSQHQGVNLRSSGDPVLYLSDPSGVDRKARRDVLDAVVALNRKQLGVMGDPEIATRIAQYEMAFRMQASVPDLTDVSNEPASTFALYGEDARKPGTFAHAALLSRRLAERGVRFVQIFHRGWDHHGSLPSNLAAQCKDADQGIAGLVKDLEQRGLLEDTLVICGGEFGRTIYSQGKLARDNYGRDHHPRCFTVWLAGGGIRAGVTYGETDDFSYNIAKDPVHIRDLNATMLRCLGIDHNRLTFKYQGLDQRLTGVEPAKVIEGILI